jgi:hypothetical protein
MQNPNVAKGSLIDQLDQAMEAARNAPAPPLPGLIIDANPTAVWRGTVVARRELNDQRRELLSQRRSVAEQLRNPRVEGVDRLGLEKQITSIDDRLLALDRQIAEANGRVAAAALVPGAVVEPPRFEGRGGPDPSFVMTWFVLAAVFVPLSFAFTRRMWRRGSNAVAALPHEILERLNRVDQAVDAMAVEIERIGEGQRFMTRVLSERARAEPPVLEADRPAVR